MTQSLMLLVTYLFLGEPLHDVRDLFPCIHCLLVFLPALEKEKIDDRQVVDVTVALELSADLSTDH